MNILMVLTSHDQLGDTGKKTGFWLEEFAAPYYVFKDAGAKVTLVSPKGGQPPLDPKSDDVDAQTALRRFDACDVSPGTVLFTGRAFGESACLARVPPQLAGDSRKTRPVMVSAARTHSVQHERRSKATARRRR